MKRYFIALVTLFFAINLADGQTINVTISGSSIINTISPWIYGRNNNLSDQPSSPVSSTNWAMYNEAGLRMYRENGGNNATTYNWRLKLANHPDWFKNVYAHDWDFSAKSLLDNTNNTQGLYALQLIGKAASSTNYNFDDWDYTQANGNINTESCWAGGGGPSAYGGNNGIGNPNLYLENWPADSAVGILNHWFSDLGYDSTRFKYWNMDNEPEVWNGTHNDIITSTITAEAFLQKYFNVAIAARAKFPSIKLTGTVAPNEWQWYAWNNSKVVGTDGISYPWMEYFIKRIAEKQDSSGVRLLDVLDIHFYPGTQNNPSLTLQLHHLWFDSTWSYSGANGVKFVGPYGWNSSVTQEYFFKRCDNWLKQYVGPNHGVTFAISEYGSTANHGSENPNVVANWYASHLGTFANNKVEFFTPWDWYLGQWEVLHLYSRYYGKYAVNTVSSIDSTLSSFASLTTNKDSLVVVLVNHDQVNPQTAQLNIQGFAPSVSTVAGLQLANLPSYETFVSHTNNALQSNTYSIVNNIITLTVPALSVTLLRIAGPQNTNVTGIASVQLPVFSVYPNPAQNQIRLEIENLQAYSAEFYNLSGQLVKSISNLSNPEINIADLSKGVYFIHLQSSTHVVVQKFVKD